MRRRVVPALLLLALLGACVTAPRTVEIPHLQLQAALERRFPQEARPGGFLPVNVSVPQLQLLPDQNRLRVDFDVDASGGVLPRGVRGALALSFAVRYVAADSTLRASNVRVEQVQVQGLPAEAAGLLRMAGRLVAERMLEDSVLYTLRPEDIARAGGRVPGEIRVTPSGLRIEMLPQPGVPR